MPDVANASSWCVCGFASGEVTMHPKVSIGAELLQQPQEIELLGPADIPPTVTVYGRITPIANRLGLRVAYVRLAGTVAPDVDLQALNSFAVSAVVRF
jgi:hypothetical protein